MPAKIGTTRMFFFSFFVAWQLSMCFGGGKSTKTGEHNNRPVIDLWLEMFMKQKHIS
jgi:hypothetical protein